MSWPLPQGAVFGIFAKQPVPGRVKTRLAQEYGDEFAAEAHEAMLFDAINAWGSDRYLAPGGRRVVVYSPSDAGPWFDARTPEAFALQPQVEGDLGERMASFFSGEFEEGAQKVILIGSDSPTLDPSNVISAFLCLDQKDVVIGPATDGGYYLIGCRPPLPPLFENIDWSTPHVLTQTLDRLAGSDRSLAVLPPWYDIDTPDDWRMLAGHVRALRAAGMDPQLPRVEQLLPRVVPPSSRST